MTERKIYKITKLDIVWRFSASRKKFAMFFSCTKIVKTGELL